MTLRRKPAADADSSGASSPTSSCKPTKSKRKTLKLTTAISDDEISERDVVEMVHKKSGGRWTAFAERAEEEELEGRHDDEEPAADNGDPGAGEVRDEDEEDEEEDEDVFVVEQILDHMMDQGSLMFKVKWEGYSKKSDQTWEPEDSLREGAEAILEQYLADHGGIDQIIQETQEAAKSKKRGRKPAAAAAAASNKRARRNGHPADSTPPASAAKAGAWQPPAGSWEDHIESIDASEDEKTGRLIVYLNWKNGKKTKHNTDVIYRRCPQKMLRFYENHVRIVKNETAEGQDVGDVENAVRDTEAKNEA